MLFKNPFLTCVRGEIEVHILTQKVDESVCVTRFELKDEIIVYFLFRMDSYLFISSMVPANKFMFSLCKSAIS